MADSDALRSRRKRLHKAGDHSLCRRCDARKAPEIPGVAGDTRVDARVSLERLAARLEAAHEADPSDAQLARVLKDVLLALRGPAESLDGELARMFAAFPGRA